MKNLVLIITSFLLAMCNSGNHLSQNVSAQAPLVVYKTKADYSNNIPIVLNLAKDKILSYPAPNDVFYNGKLAKPDKLEKDYLLDNMGLSPQSVYTSYTFEEYASLEKVPTLQQLIDSVIDKDPFVEMYDLGQRNDFKDIKQINQLIQNGFDKYERIK